MARTAPYTDHTLDESPASSLKKKQTSCLSLGPSWLKPYDTYRCTLNVAGEWSKTGLCQRNEKLIMMTMLLLRRMHNESSTMCGLNKSSTCRFAFARIAPLCPAHASCVLSLGTLCATFLRHLGTDRVRGTGACLRSRTVHHARTCRMHGVQFGMLRQAPCICTAATCHCPAEGLLHLSRWRQPIC